MVAEGEGLSTSRPAFACNGLGHVEYPYVMEPKRHSGRWRHGLERILFPPVCVVCGGPGDDGLDLCRGCRDGLPLNRPACPGCGQPLPAVRAGGPCGACLRSPPPWQRLWIPFRFEPPLDRLIRDLKFHRRLAHARLLGELLAWRLAAERRQLPELILPVPLHRRRLSRRGFNQALEMARVPARCFDLPLRTDLLHRRRDTPSQTELPALRRRANVRGAFSLDGEVGARHVVVMDDVVTTGSTVAEITRLLRRAGVETVEVWACARTAATGSGSACDDPRPGMP